jgi:hypothetical protein
MSTRRSGHCAAGGSTSTHVSARGASEFPKSLPKTNFEFDRSVFPGSKARMAKEQAQEGVNRMRARSRMAALALIAGTGIAFARAMPAPAQTGTASQERTEAPATKPAQKAEGRDGSRQAGSPTSAIQLKLAIAGLGREGCNVEVKPGNASCRFRALNVTENGEVFKKGAEGPQHISSTGYGFMELRDIELRGADKICTVAITVREPGQGARTVFRGFRLAAKGEGGAPAAAGKLPVFTCYLNSPSKIARLDEPGARK